MKKLMIIAFLVHWPFQTEACNNAFISQVETKAQFEPLPLKVKLTLAHAFLKHWKENNPGLPNITFENDVLKLIIDTNDSPKDFRRRTIAAAEKAAAVAKDALRCRSYDFLRVYLAGDTIMIENQTTTRRVRLDLTPDAL
jgi:hypothetical protein